MQVRTCRNAEFAKYEQPVLKDTLIGEEWMALRQIALGAKAAAIPRSVRNRPACLSGVRRIITRRT